MFNISTTATTTIISLCTVAGVLLHDTRLNSAVTLTLPITVSDYEMGGRLAHLTGDFHVHNERLSLSQVIRDVNGQTPRMQPRLTEDKKYTLQKRVMKGHHSFDSYSLPEA